MCNKGRGLLCFRTTAFYYLQFQFLIMYSACAAILVILDTLIVQLTYFLTLIYISLHVSSNQTYLQCVCSAFNKQFIHSLTHSLLPVSRLNIAEQ